MLWALVMAGGWGTRLWPLSRREAPKPLLKLIPGRATLLEETLKRLPPQIPASRIWIIGNQEHLRGLRRCAPQIPRAQIIGEPVSRNTAATVALGASLISKRDPDAVILILPADHWIPGKNKFHKSVQQAARISGRTGAFSVFGVTPRFPSSSYGYIRSGRKISGSVYELKGFVEKPSVARARGFLRSGRFFWHAGIFLAPAKTILNSIQKCAPAFSRKLLRMRIQNGRVVPSEAFRSLPSISFDYAVLEKLKKAYAIRCDFDFCDVGTWKTFDGLWPRDKFGNSVVGTHSAVNASGNIVYSKDKMICLQGVDDLVVIDTPDAILVSRKDSPAEEMRKVAAAFSKKKKDARPRYL